MLWFNKEKKKKMEFIQNYVPTSKAQLVQVAMMYHNGDIEKAQKFVDFYTKNMTLPDFDPIAPTTMQQLKDGASSIYGWLKDNQGDLMQAYQFVYGIVKNKGGLPGIAAEPTAEPLPPINE